ncbi:MAG TPA: NAD(P)-dependent oxidoreductase [Candidatus Acidoferrales bacterium]|nr:NAD(P)-dependent oxidoreductase [Candidatus Acidoferrales bacterium]
MTQDLQVGLIGLGNAGRPVGERLLQKGYRLRVYDLDLAPMEALAEQGATKAASAREALATMTLVVLPSSLEVRAAAEGAGGILEGIRPGFVLIDLSGTDPDFAQALQHKVEQKGAHFLGATLHAAGAPAVTIPKGLASIVVGGRKEGLEAAIRVLKDLAQRVVCVSEPWVPKALKIAVIMCAAANSIVSAEVFTWLRAQGIDPLLFYRLLKITGSRESAARIEDFLKRGKSYGGALSNSYKDIRQALEIAAGRQIPLPLMATVNQIQEMGRAHGLKRTNTPAAMGRLYEILSRIDLSEAVLEAERVFPEPHEPEVIYLEEDFKL